jgi:serine/threonine protein phosphatase PrpC
LHWAWSLSSSNDLAPSSVAEDNVSIVEDSAQLILLCDGHGGTFTCIAQAIGPEDKKLLFTGVNMS